MSNQIKTSDRDSSSSLAIKQGKKGNGQIIFPSVSLLKQLCQKLRPVNNEKQEQSGPNHYFLSRRVLKTSNCRCRTREGYPFFFSFERARQPQIRRRPIYLQEENSRVSACGCSLLVCRRPAGMDRSSQHPGSDVMPQIWSAAQRGTTTSKTPGEVGRGTLLWFVAPQPINLSLPPPVSVVTCRPLRGSGADSNIPSLKTRENPEWKENIWFDCIDRPYLTWPLTFFSFFSDDSFCSTRCSGKQRVMILAVQLTGSNAAIVRSLLVSPLCGSSLRCYCTTLARLRNTDSSWSVAAARCYGTGTVFAGTEFALAR